MSDESPPRLDLQPLLAVAVAAGVLSLASCGEAAPTGPQTPPPPANAAPVASAGSDAPASVGLTVRLDGSASTDADGDSLSYAWTLTASPTGSAAVLADAATATPRFVPDLAGAYTAQLVVNDGTEDSPVDAVTITAADNTAAATIGAGGGMVTSSDGRLELDVPAGALGTDTEISITLVEESQLPAAVNAMDPASILVYDLKPDGLQFANPVAVSATVPGGVQQVGDTVQLGVPIPFTIYDGGNGLVADTLSTVTVEGSTATGDVVVTAAINHFSNFVSVQGWITVSTAVPFSVDVGVVFEVPVEVIATPSDARLTGAPTQTDASGPLVAPSGQFDPTFSGGVSRNDYVCTAEGAGWYKTFVDLEYSMDWEGLAAGIADIWVPNAVYKSRATLIDDVDCLPPPAPPPGTFVDVRALQSEKTSIMHDDPGRTLYGVTHGDGVTIVDDDGQVMREVLPGAALGNLIGAVGPLDAMALGPFLAYGGEGIYGVEYGAVEALARLLISISGVTDNTTRVTDAVHFKWTPTFHGDGPNATSHAPIDRFAFAQFEDRNVLFLDMDASGNVTVVPELANAFVDSAGVSVFGSDRPLALWIGPNGFDENNPMLVLTIDDTTFGDLNVIELVNGVAVRTTVPDFTSIIEPRELACDDVTGICGMSSFRTHSFGGIYTFRWDGQTTVTRLTPRLSFAPVGIDVVNTGTSVLMTGTDTERFVNGAFQFEYRVIEFDLNGAQLRSAAFLVPQGCADPFHAVFRRRIPTFDQVLISCYGDGSSDGMVAASTFVWPAPE